MRTHAGEGLAGDFFVAVTATFRRIHVFVVLDISTRQIVHWNLTRHPTAEWTIEQFRNGITIDGPYRFVIHDHDAIYAPAVDAALTSMDLSMVKTPVRVAQANAFCERDRDSASRVSGLDDSASELFNVLARGGRARLFEPQRG